MFELWMMKLGTIVTFHNGTSSGWREWDEWRSYYDDGMTPEEAYQEAHRQGYGKDDHDASGVAARAAQIQPVSVRP